MYSIIKFMKRPDTTGWHELAETQALEALNADALAGLSTQESKDRQARFGANRLTPKKGKNPLLLLLFLSQFYDPLIYILLVSALITGSLKSWVDASVIFGVVFLNAIIGFIQEFNALRAIDALSRALSISAAVLRDGVRQVCNLSRAGG
jgi:magnesium-transporting ATPase (P-type)